MHRKYAPLLVLPVLLLDPHPHAHAHPPSGETPSATARAATPGVASEDATQPDNPRGQAPAPGRKKSAEKPKYPPYAEVLKDAEKIAGLIPLFRKDNKVYAELGASQLDKDFIVLITIARGIGQTPILGGFSWGFGDDWVWQFRKVGERVHVVRRNLRFTADRGSPQAKAVQLGYSDSVLFSLPIATKSPRGALVVDLSPVFMSDLPQISSVLRGFAFSASKSTWADVKGFAGNVEIQVAATYASSGDRYIESVADTRGVTVHVHYSISALPRNNYEPRAADDRVGYFLTVIKDYSKNDPKDRFMRYINRWNLVKADPEEEVSPPAKPIEFWLEDTIPFKYRKPIREGILEWNEAFEKAGFVNAIEVRQKDADDEWDPADIRYNTFRWITAGAGFAMGPSRVNPRTGQILDADIIFDADFLQFWKQEYETFTPRGVSLFTGGPLDLETYREQLGQSPHDAWHRHSPLCACNLLSGKSHDLAMAHAMLASRTRNPEDLEKLIMQALKEVTMHEVGHTLGLRHNFKASTLYSLEEVQDVRKTRETGLTASVMDYTPVNIVPQDMRQGDYYSTTIGPYDRWAIEYGYTPRADEEALEEIAKRSAEPGLALATDEDARGIDPDPHSNRWDLSSDVIFYAKTQARLVAEAWPDVVERMVEAGEGYEHARRAFGVLLATHGRAMYIASRYVGGVYVNRSHKGDPGAAPPLDVVPVDKQRQALQLLEEHVLSDKPFEFPPELYNHLAASHWSHWGTSFVDRKDYPAHEVILMWQDRVLARLLSSLTLTRIHDNELKIPSDRDALTTAELLERLTSVVFAEVEAVKAGQYNNRSPYVSSLRRNLQRRFLQRLSNLALGRTGAPEDAETIAYAQLQALKRRLEKVLASDVELDSYSQAHFEGTVAKITQVLEATIVQSL